MVTIIIVQKIAHLRVNVIEGNKTLNQNFTQPFATPDSGFIWSAI